MDQSTLFLQQTIFRATTLLKQCCDEKISAKDTGLTERQFRVLELIYKLHQTHQEGCSVRQLAEKLNITSAAASEMVDLLSARDMVEKHPNPQDRRAVALTLTPLWQQKFLLADHQFNLLLSEFIGNLGENERTAIFRCAEKFYLFANQKIKSGKERS